MKIKKMLMIILSVFLLTFIFACNSTNIKNETSNYFIYFDSNGGTELSPLELKVDQEINITVLPTKIGYSFDAWNQEVPTKMPNSNLYLKAIWKINKYTITFDTDGGNIIEPLIINYQEKIYLPNNPVKEGYKFLSWDKILPEIMPSENLSIKALWIKNEEPIKPTPQDNKIIENFEALEQIKKDGGNFSSYEDFDYSSDESIKWEIVNGRIDLGLVEGGNAITIAGKGNEITEAGMGRIYTSALVNGISNLKFDARLPFSPKSTYPQGPGGDKAVNVKIKVLINDVLVSTLVFDNDDEANKGKTFEISNLNIGGTYSLSIEISSGHAATIDNIEITTNKEANSVTNNTIIDFENESFDFDLYENIHKINDIDFMFKEVHTKIMHASKESAYMDSEINGQVVARFRGNSNNINSTPSAYMHTVVAFNEIKNITFDARLFGEQTFFTYDSVINIYTKNSNEGEWLLLESFDELTTNFTSYNILVNQLNVHIKIEVINGTVNIDNIKFN